MTSVAAPPATLAMGVDATTQTDVAQKSASPATPVTGQPVSETLRANQIRQAYRPPHQLNSPDTSHAGSAALLAAQHTSSPTAWTFVGNAGASAAASLARSQSKPVEAWKPNKLSSAGAAANAAHRTSISEQPGSKDKDAGASAAAALRRTTSGGTESQDNASLTNSPSHAMRAASTAHKPSLTKPVEQQKPTSPSHALRGASAAHRDSAPIKSTSPTYFRTAEEAARIQALAHELAKRDLEGDAPGGVKRSDLSRVATLTMARKQASDQAEAEREQARKRQIEEEALSQYHDQLDLDEAARRIVAERIARTTLTGEEADAPNASKAAGASLSRGTQRVKDWERVLKELEEEDKTDKEKNMGWLRQSMRRNTPLEPGKMDPTTIMAVAQRNVKSQLDGMDKSIAAEWLVLGKPQQGDAAARNQAQAKELEQKGAADLEQKQQERATTYDIGGLIMTHEQVEAIAQKHVNEVLAEINEKVEREKERIEAERLEREARLREKQQEREVAQKRAAEEKAERDRIKAETREAKAQEAREKAEAAAVDRAERERVKVIQREHKAAEKKKRDEEKAAETKKREEEKAAERKKKEEEKALKATQKEQAAAVDGVLAFDQQKEIDEKVKAADEASKANNALVAETAAVGAAVGGVIAFDKEKEAWDARKRLDETMEKGAQEHEAVADQQKAVDGVLEFDKEKEAWDARKHLDESMEKGAQQFEAEKETRDAVTGVLAFDSAKEDWDARKHLDEELEKGQQLAAVEKEQRKSVGGVLDWDHQKEGFEARDRLDEAREKGEGLAAEEAAVRSSVSGVITHDGTKELEGQQKAFDESIDAAKAEKEATAEQAAAADVDPDAGLEEPTSPKGKGIKSWFKDKRKSISRRLSRAGSIAATGPKSPGKEKEEDIYGEQVPLSKEDSSKGVSVAKDEPKAEEGETDGQITPRGSGGVVENPSMSHAAEEPLERTDSHLTQEDPDSHLPSNRASSHFAESHLTDETPPFSHEEADADDERGDTQDEPEETEEEHETETPAKPSLEIAKTDDEEDEVYNDAEEVLPPEEEEKEEEGKGEEGKEEEGKAEKKVEEKEGEEDVVEAPSMPIAADTRRMSGERSERGSRFKEEF